MKNYLLFMFSVAFTVLSISAKAQEVIILEKKRDINISLVQKRLVINEENRLTKKFLKNINRHTSESVYYSSLNPLLKIEAQTRVLDKKGRYKKHFVKVFETQDMVMPGIFYGGYKKQEFIFPAVAPEAIGELSYTKSISDPHIIGSFFFDDRHPVEKSSFSVSFPADVEIEYSLFGTETLDLNFTRDTLKNSIRYTWQLSDLEAREYDSNAPSFQYFAPHIILRIASYKTGNTRTRVTKNTDDLFQWYNSLINRMPADDNLEALKLQVAKLKKDTQSREELIKKIYRWTQANIKYIAFENGMAGFIPRSAGDVFNRKYGDCKDMANLLRTMLQMADIPAYLVWAGTNSKPYSYYDVPSTVADNHMICAIRDGDNGFTFLDPTNSNLSLGTSPRLLQGKEALIRLSDSEYEIVKVPETASDLNIREDKVSLKVSNGMLQGTNETRLRGYLREAYFRDRMVHEFRNKTNFVQNHLALGKKSSAYFNEQKQEGETEVRLRFDAHFKNALIMAGNKLYINLNLDPSISEYQIDDIEKRTQPVQQDYKHTYRFICTLEIPEGYEVDFMPESAEVNYDNTRYKMSYEVEGQSIRLEKEIVSDFLYLEKESFEAYQQFYQSLVRMNNEQIVLKKS